MLTPKLPESDYTLVIRTDFSDDAVWERVCQKMQEPQTEDAFQAYVECISDQSCDGLRPEMVRSRLPKDSGYRFVFVVDSVTQADTDNPVLVVDLRLNSVRTFRVIPSEAWGVENNLRLANMDWEDFAAACDLDGVFRGFP